jgi:hypothetical protein
MQKSELNKLCSQPGSEGALWRLVRTWDPDAVARWMLSEKQRNDRGFTPFVAVSHVAEVMSGAAAILALHLQGDRQGAIFGDQGLYAMSRLMAQRKLDQAGGPHKIVPAKPGIILPG